MFLSVDRGHRTAVKDHETGESWHGSVDLTFPEQGFVWVISDLGERKLLDITVGEDFAAEKRLSDTAAGRSQQRYEQLPEPRRRRCRKDAPAAIC